MSDFSSILANACRQMNLAETITTHLQPLIGQRLTIARRAVDMRIFHFGPVRPAGKGSVGLFAVHIQCFWRIEGPQGLVTGSADLWEPAEETPLVDWKTWHYDKNPNLQDQQLRAWLGSSDQPPRSLTTPNRALTVAAVAGDVYGGATLQFSGGDRLVIFPTGTRGEDWRFFRPDTDEPHFVVTGGKIEAE